MTQFGSAVQWRAVVVAHGFSWRKRALVRDFTGRADVRFISRGADVPAGADLLLWGSAAVPADVAGQVRVVRLEDGFLRSVGLGADLIRPISWVLDTRGIYYDARSPSDMETLLQTTIFSEASTQRAGVLRQQVVQSGLSKYNLDQADQAPWRRPDCARTVALVIGQVETDASIATGTLDIRSNMALLQAVRRARPDAWLVYKPHPDVVAGLRRSGSQEEQARQWADEVLTQGSPGQLFPVVDEVHVMSSLTGFEALLRHKPVFCYGQPFYAGWGLTHDSHVHPRRTRRLTLDELVAGALLLYPVYVSCESRRRCTPEQALQELLAWRGRTQGRLSWWRQLLRPLLARR
ncbi:beta-3-deoxy-D-manno-oct-2-ulosonic acid transferase [Polaromonas sp.]|uniref:capsular polysaccharide export protein, LipB/KpsS family n=1 Tax=Polaromonas sp. TaxID=1869339 RepID=UPI0017DB396F|nr:beta-3-deoxy-D-manno-oct-2-ulosonic acid transferase [Polaromonas sp.]NMM04852.1 beta-3-deoxy-D-manno-oct-2-ulosonic acid transferase [Polaromonas sp.]